MHTDTKDFSETLTDKYHSVCFEPSLYCVDKTAITGFQSSFIAPWR